MLIVRDHQNLRPALKGSAVAIGNFDGLHRGHQAVIAAAAAQADRLGVPLSVLAFDPHPRRWFKPDEPAFALTPFRAKSRLLKRLGADIFFALPFDGAMAGRDAAAFVDDVLIKGLGVTGVAVGYDFGFGAGRSGTASQLAWIGAMEGFDVTIVPPQGDGADGEVFSSTLIRDALMAGDPRRAATMLGHWWSIDGRVGPGDQRGRTIGFPTANVAMEGTLQPALGVYAVRVDVTDGPLAGTYAGVANVGRRPTFDKKDVLLEVHLLDFAGDLYGRELSVAFIDFIRPEMKFGGLEALTAQIAKDAGTARERLGDPANAADLFRLAPLSRQLGWPA